MAQLKFHEAEMGLSQTLMTILGRSSNYSDFLGVCPILCAKNTLLGAQQSASLPCWASAGSQKGPAPSGLIHKKYPTKGSRISVLPLLYFQWKLSLGIIKPSPCSDWPLFLALLEAQFPLLVLCVGLPPTLTWALPNTTPPLRTFAVPSKLDSWPCHQTGSLAFGHLRYLVVRSSQNKSDDVPRVSCPTAQTPKYVYQREQQASEVPFLFGCPQRHETRRLNTRNKHL